MNGSESAEGTETLGAAPHWSGPFGFSEPHLLSHGLLNTCQANEESGKLVYRGETEQKPYRNRLGTDRFPLPLLSNRCRLR